MLDATSSNDLVSIHAVRQCDGTVGVMLINKDPAATYRVKVSLAGDYLHGVAAVSTYGMGSSAVGASQKSVRGSSFTVSVAPYSLTTVRLP